MNEEENAPQETAQVEVPTFMLDSLDKWLARRWNSTLQCDAGEPYTIEPKEQW